VTYDRLTDAAANSPVVALRGDANSGADRPRRDLRLRSRILNYWRPSRRAMNASRSNKCTSCSFLSNAPCNGGISFFRVAARAKFPGRCSSAINSLSQSSSSEVDVFLMAEDIGPEILRERDPKKLIPPLHGALLKNEQDVHLFERLAFMARREGRQ